eukprot:TRINITY_DN9697_c0_g1_i7.p1 TRINITY_DN9697_c0_g1~~TRINITY_DN9697_c0_g1_i7.p1  ORF type:complete len:922 (+),score=166.82 TRINITY_DN9697_c0_g1_i7:40-2766(+)
MQMSESWTRICEDYASLKPKLFLLDSKYGYGTHRLKTAVLKDALNLSKKLQVPKVWLQWMKHAQSLKDKWQITTQSLAEFLQAGDPTQVRDAAETLWHPLGTFLSFQELGGRIILRPEMLPNFFKQLVTAQSKEILAQYADGIPRAAVESMFVKKCRDPPLSTSDSSFLVDLLMKFDIGFETAAPQPYIILPHLLPDSLPQAPSYPLSRQVAIKPPMIPIGLAGRLICKVIAQSGTLWKEVPKFRWKYGATVLSDAGSQVTFRVDTRHRMVWLEAASLKDTVGNLEKRLHDRDFTLERMMNLVDEVLKDVFKQKAARDCLSWQVPCKSCLALGSALPAIGFHPLEECLAVPQIVCRTCERNPETAELLGRIQDKDSSGLRPMVHTGSDWDARNVETLREGTLEVQLMALCKSVGEILQMQYPESRERLKALQAKLNPHRQLLKKGEYVDDVQLVIDLLTITDATVIGSARDIVMAYYCDWDIDQFIANIRNLAKSIRLKCEQIRHSSMLPKPVFCVLKAGYDPQFSEEEVALKIQQGSFPTHFCLDPVASETAQAQLILRRINDTSYTSESGRGDNAQELAKLLCRLSWSEAEIESEDGKVLPLQSTSDRRRRWLSLDDAVTQSMTTKDKRIKMDMFAAIQQCYMDFTTMLKHGEGPSTQQVEISAESHRHNVAGRRAEILKLLEHDALKACKRTRTLSHEQGIQTHINLSKRTDTEDVHKLQHMLARLEKLFSGPEAELGQIRAFLQTLHDMLSKQLSENVLSDKAARMSAVLAVVKKLLALSHSGSIESDHVREEIFERTQSLVESMRPQPFQYADQLRSLSEYVKQLCHRMTLEWLEKEKLNLRGMVEQLCAIEPISTSADLRSMTGIATAGSAPPPPPVISENLSTSADPRIMTGIGILGSPRP